MADGVRAEQTTPTGTSTVSAARGQDQGHLSFSQLSAYQNCGEKYRLSYIEKVERRAQGPFIGGIAVHDTIAESEAKGWWEDPDTYEDAEGAMIAGLHERLQASVRKAGGEDAVRWGGRGGGETLEWWRTQGAFMLRRYVETRAAFAEQGYGFIGVEMRVVADLPGVDRPVIGYLDMFLMHEDGEPLIVDWKSGRIGGGEPFQFATYAVLLRQQRGIEVDRAVAVYLRAADADRRIAPVRFQGLVPRIEESFATLSKAIDVGLFTPNPNAYCASCSVNHACWYWQNTGGAEDA